MSLQSTLQTVWKYCIITNINKVFVCSSNLKGEIVMPEDENGIAYAIHNGKMYYNWTNASKYLSMTDSGFRRKVEKIRKEQGIAIPLIRLPFSEQNVYHDKRVLDVFMKSVVVGREKEWYEKLKKVVDEVSNED